ncbi:MAG: hypothetical protein ACPL1K_05535 [Candidatus Kryptoniota bacterium]
MTDKFDKLLRIFQELSGVKSAADTSSGTSPRVESKVSTHKPGKHDKETSDLLSSMYPTALDVGESNPNTKQEASAATTDVRFPLEGDSDVSKSIKNLDLNPENYKLASVDDDYLQQLFVNVSSEILNDIQRYGQPTQRVPEYTYAQQTYQTTKAAADTQDAFPVTDEDVQSFTIGLLTGIQKQAEADAEEVGQYIWAYLKDSLQNLKQAEDDNKDEEEKDETGTETPEEDKEKNNNPKVNSNNKPGDTTKDTGNPEDILEPKKDTMGEKKIKDDTSDDELSEDQAKEVLKDMQEPTEDEVLQNLGLALTELGITPDQLAAANQAGAKLASAFKNFQRKGKFRLEPVSRSKRAAVDYIKNYVQELLERSH